LAGDERLEFSKILVADATPANALQAAFMTMRGVPVVARDAPLIRETLGPGGYVTAPPAGDGPEYRSEWVKALSIAASDAGRSVSAAARRFLKENYGASAAAESLESLYESVGRDKL
jgi:glycosyltransferase involved in cell wall biosynthesis